MKMANFEKGDNYRERGGHGIGARGARTHPSRAMPDLNAEGCGGSCQAKKEVSQKEEGPRRGLACTEAQSLVFPGVRGSSMSEKFEQEHGSTGGRKGRSSQR